MTYESGALELDLVLQEVRAHGTAVPLGGRAFEILAILVQSAGDLVSKDDLMKRVWPGAIVEENTLHVHIAAIRKALGADRGLLKTASGRGYRLLGRWTRREASASDESVSAKTGFVDRPNPRTNLPVSPVDLIGRTFAARHVEEVLSAYRAVTLTGPGGIGKTVLALQVAHSVSANSQMGAYLVDLASLSDPDLVPSTVAGVLDVRLNSENAVVASVARAVGQRRLLLVMDNCEHLIDAVANIVEALVQMCPGVSVLATSRENLRIRGEYVYRVGPLSVPTEQDQEPDAILAQSAVELFIARIDAVQTAFSLNPTSLIQIAALCRRLDGIPLAIEFAAARAATLGLAQVIARLDDRFGFLTAGRRTALPRHQTLQATLDWSYELLPEWERRLLRRSAIFPAGFTFEAAAAVAGDLEHSAASVADGIANLVAKSLLSFDGAVSGGRWRSLETIRAYALEKLSEKSEVNEAARLFARYFCDLFRSRPPGSPRQSGPQDETSDRQELDNLRAAIDWALSPNGDLSIGLDLTAVSAPLWFQLSLMAEYRQRVETALKRVHLQTKPDDDLEMRLQIALSHAIWYAGPFAELDAMRKASDRAAELADRVGNNEIRLKAVWGAWAAGRGGGEHQLALKAAMQYETIADSAGDKDSLILGARMLALTHHDLGNLKHSSQYVTSVLGQISNPALRPGGDLQVDARVAMLTLLARVQWLQGFPDQADATAREAIDGALRLHHWFSICYVLFFAGGPVSLWTGNLAEAQFRLEMLRDRTGENFEFPGFNVFTGNYAAAVRLRQGGDADALTAAYIEPRMQELSKAVALGEMTRRASIALPFPDDIPSDTPWSLPEVLRVDAELLLWRGGPGALSAAETKLQRSLELARQQAALSWELRTALSLARLRMGRGQRGEALKLLAPVYSRFTEGLGTSDLRSARAILESPE